MPSPAPLSSRIRFDAFELDAASAELRSAGVAIKLRLQAIQVLIMLTERAGHVVTREEIRQRLWSADTFVDFERGINFCINQIRAALGDDAEEPRFVETLPKRGYRFIAPVTVEVSREPAAVLTLAAPLGVLPALPAPKTPAPLPASAGIQVVAPNVSGSSGPQLERLLLLVVILGIGFGATFAVAFVERNYFFTAGETTLRDLRMTRLTNSGAVTGVSISPDGRYVAYAKLNGAQQSLWLRQIAAQSDVQILFPGTGFHGITFSGDGNYIYFVRSADNNPFFKYLYSVPTLGGPVKKLLTDVDSPVSFSPDGSQFVYEHCVENHDDIELKIANADSSGDHLLAVLHHATSLLFQPGPSWSPDGRTIAVPALLVGPQSGWVLDAVSVADGSVRELFSRPNSIGRPVWWRGDTLLVPFHETVGQRGQLWTVSFPRGNAQRFTNDLTSYGASDNAHGFPLERSRDGKTLVALTTDQSLETWVAPATSPAEARELNNNDVPLFAVAEAADRRLWGVNPAGQLWIMNPDGSQGAPYGEYHDIHSIASCGRFMIVLHGGSGPLSLTRLDSDGERPVELASGSLFGPFCSPDAKFVYYGGAEQPQKVWRVPVEGGAPTEVAKILGDQISGPLNISPDGTLIAYGYTVIAPVPGWFAAIIPVAGGPQSRTMPIPRADGAGPFWSPDGKGLQFLWAHDDVTNLWEQPLSGGQPKQLTKFTSGSLLGVNWSFDRKRLFMTRGEIRSDAVLLSDVR